jgi:hypothetical protein
MSLPFDHATHLRPQGRRAISNTQTKRYECNPPRCASGATRLPTGKPAPLKGEFATLLITRALPFVATRHDERGESAVRSPEAPFPVTHTNGTCKSSHSTPAAYSSLDRFFHMCQYL